MPFRLPLSAALIATLAPLAGAQTVLHVNAKAAPGGNGASWPTAFQALQPALAAAQSNPSIQEVWVAFGTYAEGATLQVRAGLGLYGGFRGVEPQRTLRIPDPRLTVLDGGGAWTVLSFSGAVPATTVVDGFTITKGYTADNGGGLYFYDGSPTLANLRIAGNRADKSGGGLYTYKGNPRIERVLFLENSAGDDGGGLYCYEGSPVLLDAAFERNRTTLNTSSDGGGIWCYQGNPQLTRVRFLGNLAAGRGGGYASYSGSPTLAECLYAGNSAADGAGHRNYEGSPVFHRCLFQANLASGNGAGFYTYTGAPVLTSSILVGNQAVKDGGGIYSYKAGLTLANCNLVGNAAAGGGGMRQATTGTAPAVLTNCIVYGNTGGQIQGAPTVNHSCVEGGCAGMNNIAQNPALLNPGSGNHHILPSSPCFNQGAGLAPGLPATDFDGQPRSLAGAVDIGADECDPAGCFLQADRAVLSLAAGGWIRYNVIGGSARAGMAFGVLPSLSGTSPGLALGGSLQLWVNFDRATWLLLGAFPQAFVGILDAAGNGSTGLQLPPGLPPELAGLDLSTAGLLVDPASAAFSATTNWDAVRFQ